MVSVLGGKLLDFVDSSLLISKELLVCETIIFGVELSDKVKALFLVGGRDGTILVLDFKLSELFLISFVLRRHMSFVRCDFLNLLDVNYFAGFLYRSVLRSSGAIMRNTIKFV